MQWEGWEKGGKRSFLNCGDKGLTVSRSAINIFKLSNYFLHVSECRPFWGRSIILIMGFPGDPSGKESACQCRRLETQVWFLRSGRSPGGRHGNPLQYFCLENPMDRGAWRATVCRVRKSQTQLKWLSMNSCIILMIKRSVLFVWNCSITLKNNMTPVVYVRDQ